MDNEKNNSFWYDFKECVLDNLELLLDKSLAYDGNPEIDNEIRRLLHTIKGEAGMMDEKLLSIKCHNMEEQLDVLEKEDIADALVSFVDNFRQAIEDIQNNVLLAQSSHFKELSPTESQNMIRCLVVEDDFTSRVVLQKYLSSYADCHVAVNGKEALTAFKKALLNRMPYDLICLDIMMPEMDGRQTLRAIREIESNNGIGGLDMTKIIMTTALDDSKNIMGSFREGCEAYVVKPIQKTKLLNELWKLGLFTAKVGIR